MRINTNILSLSAQRNLAQTTRAIARAMERLSSGQRINRAQDGAAELAQSTSLEAQSRALYRGTLNINDSQSKLTELSSDLGAMRSIVVRLKELALQSANGTLSDNDRENLDIEFQQLKSSIGTLIDYGSWKDINVNSNLKLQTGSSSKDYISLTLPKLTVDSVLAPPEDEGLLGTGTFSITTTFAVAAGYSIHSVSDFTDDTNDDILFSNSGTGSANLWMSNGDGTMTSSATVTFGAGYSPLGIYDVNGDGKNDIIGTNTSAGISVYLSNGDGTFSHTQTISRPYISYSVTDIDADGDMDISISDASSIYFYTNQGAGLFTQTSTISTGAATGMSIGTDLNNDGYRDIVATSSSSGRVYLNDGSNNFSLQDTLAISTNAFATVTDLDRDGVRDIVYTNFGTGNYVIYQGNGNGTFAQRLTTTTASTSYLSADFNQDGEIDYATYTSATGTIRTYLGNGAGSFVQNGTYTSGTNGFFSLTDLDGDGIQDDITIISGSSTSSMLLNNGLGTFTEIATLANPGFSGVSSSSDINSDGYSDIFIASTTNGQATNLVSTGSGGLTTINFNLGGSMAGVYSQDLNGDGYKDLFTIKTGASAELYAFILNPSTKYYSAYAPVALDGQNGLRPADFNNDGVLDIFAFYSTTEVGTIAVQGTRSSDNSSSDDIHIRTQEQAQNILDIFDESLARLSLVDSEIGAIQRRLESASSMNMITYENIKQARSQLADADYAIELAEFTRVKILEQAGLSVLSQANSSARLALDLLKTLI